MISWAKCISCQEATVLDQICFRDHNSTAVPESLSVKSGSLITCIVSKVVKRAPQTASLTLRGDGEQAIFRCRDMSQNK